MRSIQTIALFVVISILLPLFPYPLRGEEDQPTDRGDGVYENDGDWIIEEGEDFLYEDKTIIINGNLTVDGKLNLTHCHLIMNASTSRIMVNGTLELHGTNISGNGTYYDLIVHGRLQSTDSNFSEIAGEGSPLFIGGLQLHSTDVDIRGGSIHDCEQSGMFVNANVTIRGLLVEWNAINVIVNHSSPIFMDCIMRYPDGSNFRLYNSAHPTFIGGQSGTYTFADDESSWTKGNRLSVHVTYENGTSIPGVTVTAVSRDSLVTGQDFTDASGWVRDMVLPQETIYASGQMDTLYTPYLISAKKFGLTVLESIPFTSDMTLHMVLSGDHFGEDISRGDFNGDGLLDLAVGAPGNSTGIERHGAVFIFLNRGYLEFSDVNEAMADHRIEGVKGTEFGSVVSQGDINGDGHDDLLVSAPKSSARGLNSGRVYFFLGAETIGWTDTTDAAFTIDGEPGSRLGQKLLTAGLNSDSYDDVIIGDERHSYVCYGTADPSRDFGGVSGSGSMPTAANHTLIPGNLSCGDANGDGLTDVVIAGDAGNVVYYGGPNEVSTPHILEFERFEGDATKMYTRNGNMTLDKIGQVRNGDFDFGWENWTFVSNSNGEHAAVPRLVDEDIGDWVTSPVSGGPTGGYGDIDDILDGMNGHSSGKLRSDAFYVADDIEEITLWYRWKVNSFDDYAYEGMNIKLYRASDDTELLTIREWMSSEDSMDHEESGFLNASLVDLHGETVYLAMETLGGDGGYDDALFQIDDVNLLPDLYHQNGTFESDWIVFERNLSSFAPSWEEEPNNGTLILKFRTDAGLDWSEISGFVNGEEIELGTPSDRLQFRVVMTGNGSSTPVLRALEIGYLLEGQIVPLDLSTDYEAIKLGDIDGNGADDLLFLETGARGGTGIRMHPGGGNLSQDYNVSNITPYYSGTVNDFSFLDLERDGRDEIVVLGDGMKILNETGDTVWEKTGNAVRVSGDAASDPEHDVYKGRIFFLPASDVDLRVIAIDAPMLADPMKNLSLNITIGNVGMRDAADVTLYLNITSGGYSHSLSRSFNLSSMNLEILTFHWTVPEDEGTVYTLLAEIGMDGDRVPGDNRIGSVLESKRHGIGLSVPNPIVSAHGGDDLGYSIILNNTGTFGTENVTLASNLPAGWIGGFYHLGSPIDSIVVEDSVELTFIASSPADEIMGNFSLNITASAASASARVVLTGVVLRPDLVVGEIALYRGDGTMTNDTLHGVAGDSMELRIRVVNRGLTYSTPFNVSVTVNGTHFQDVRCDGLPKSEHIWVTIRLTLDAGLSNITVWVDSLHEVPEADKSNNNQSRMFAIKNSAPVGDYNLSGVVRNIFGEGVEFVNVTLEWRGHRVEEITDENGRFYHILAKDEYFDAGMLFINATDGSNVTNVTILTFSEDGGKHLILTLNQYVVEIEGPEGTSTIETGGNVSLIVEVTNKGNVDASFILVPSAVPVGWNVTFPMLEGGLLFLGVKGSEVVEVVIQSSSDPRHSQGYQRYSVSVKVSSELNPLASDVYAHRIEVIPYRSLRVSVLGKNTTEAEPYSTQSFDFMVENLGNVRDTFIPKLFSSQPIPYHFNISHALLEISGSALFTLNLTMPNIPAGDLFVFNVGDGNAHTEKALLEMDALDYYALTCTYQMEHAGSPGEMIVIPLTITNTGNLRENITIVPYSQPGSIVASNGTVLLDMGESGNYGIEALLPLDAVSDDVYSLSINLTCTENEWVNITINVTIEEIFGIDLVLVKTTMVPEKDRTTYLFLIEARNTGNGMHTISFRAEGSHPHLTVLPDPLPLAPRQTADISAMIVVPPDQTSVIDNYILPMIGNRQFRELNLRILSYKQSLTTDVQTQQFGGKYVYTINVTNRGERFEELHTAVGLPEHHWESSIDKGILELMPGEKRSIRLQIDPPDSKEYWGGDLFVSLGSVSGQSVRLVLDKPPIAVLGVNMADNATIEDTLTFTGSQSYWNIVEYRWDLGDGHSSAGSTVRHSFSRSGLYEIVLTVTDENNFTASASRIVQIENLGPLPVIVTTPLNRTIQTGDPITFDATHSIDRDGDILNYLWEVGKSEERSSPVFQHIFQTEGDYEATLTITDDGGESANSTITIHVVKRTTSPDQTSQQGTKRETDVDPISYLPAYATLLIGMGMVLVVVRKRRFIRFIREKMVNKQNQMKP